MEMTNPLELASLIEEWLQHKKIQGRYDYDKLKLSMSSITWTDIYCNSEPSQKNSANKETCILVRNCSPLLVDEPECKVELYSGLLKYGSTGFHKKLNFSFNNLPDYILNYLSMTSLKLDLANEVTKTEPSPYYFKPKSNQQIDGVAGPVWKGCYGGLFTLIANLSGDVKVIEDNGSVQEENLKEIVEFLQFSNKTEYILVTPEGCKWKLTGECEFNLYS